MSRTHTRLTRREVEALIDRAIEALDLLDDDPDLEIEEDCCAAGDDAVAAGACPEWRDFQGRAADLPGDPEDAETTWTEGMVQADTRHGHDLDDAEDDDPGEDNGDRERIDEREPEPEHGLAGIGQPRRHALALWRPGDPVIVQDSGQLTDRRGRMLAVICEPDGDWIDPATGKRHRWVGAVT